ncbi:flavin-containing monooxygenase [Nocardia bovistercoris]|uniref:NAD(P)/FAD-dependent oxidoreductase n=1 Tax=Nocardia bovistercoris TaxID=2785916 RepID=A0A931I782_9NOCA|nr:NAD(P)/FAD-dependent oxidoreductase [Nocardia bovistercoris]MBH0775336.1 NAD(P)/FAD-dependent oxidoreductase [Nocardia bovistercoris]
MLTEQRGLVTEVVLDLKVAIVGAGFGGIGMGVALKQAGYHDFVILEKGDRVGGVWRENTYPGCDCDVPSHLYSFSFAPYRSARQRYPGQERILDYLIGVADEYGLTPHLRLNSALTTATYLDDLGRWELTTADGAIIRADIAIFALGQLHRPYIPDIPGRNDFAGTAFHTARWDHHVDARGREVAVIGTGSSAAQLLPKIASIARRVHLYQRTPHWLLPKPSREFGPLSRLAMQVPGAHQAYRTALHRGADAVLAPIMHRGWSALPAQWFARAYLHRRVADPRLRAAVTPDYPIGGKRIIFDSTYYPTLARHNVRLVTDPIQRIVADGVETVDGAHRPAAILVYATGFRAAEFMAPITVRGRDGRLLHEQWRDGAEAFMGLAVPGFPNAFLIAGPNSFTPAGSNPTMKEYQIDYILECLRWHEQLGGPAVEVGPVAMANYQRWLRRAIAKTVWSGPVHSWYKHVNGRVVNPWPGTTRDFARMLAHHPVEAFTAVARDRNPVPEAASLF